MTGRSPSATDVDTVDRAVTAPRRPNLLPLVYGATLTLMILSGAALALLGTEHVRSAGMAAIRSADQGFVSDFVASELRADEIEQGGLGADRASDVVARLAVAAERNGIVAAHLITPDRNVLVGFGTPLENIPLPGDGIGAAFGATPSIALVGEGGRDGRPVLVDLVPIVMGGEVRLLAVLARDPAALLAEATAAWQDLVIVTSGAAVFLALILFVIFGNAQRRLVRQEQQIEIARRQDPLTGLLNHGALVATLTARIEAARTDGSSVAVALIDIDNFRLLNQTHGDAAGDRALLQVADALSRESSGWAALGRYGPDEFLAVALASTARDLEPTIQRVRTNLEIRSLAVETSERVPITVSAGISYFPFQAASASELLSSATIALGEAKASGGDEIRIADAWETPEVRSNFDVLQGLVNAVDTKDRYTKRHSVDVARYALFLANRIGVDPALHDSIRVAGLLHDLGKIGIPDDILRKPSALTPHEREIVERHVELGDLIARDLPDIDFVRAGIRSHHERWDGTGYRDGLRGEDIPLIARILAVCDAFSAMTTTRPYRKALPVEEALQRLLDAAGTQLDPFLASAFVDAIVESPDTPIGEIDRRLLTLWAPRDAAVRRASTPLAPSTAA